MSHNTHLAIRGHDKNWLTRPSLKIKPGYDFEPADGGGRELGAASCRSLDGEPGDWSSEVFIQGVVECIAPTVVTYNFCFVGS